MYKISLPWFVWLMLGPLLAADASPQFSTSIVTKTFEFLKGASSPTPTVFNCMGETSDSLVNWQNPDFPKNESLPGICTLTLNPKEGTCAYRLNFDNLNLAVKEFSFASLLSAFSCPTDNPHIKISSVNYTAPARCQNLTGYEGIVQLLENSTEPVVLLLQTDPDLKFAFRVNISAVPCADIKSFKSPNVCGIKNQQLNDSLRKNLRSDTLPQDAALDDPSASQLEKLESIEEARKSRQLSNKPLAEILAEPDTDDSQGLNQDSTSTDPEYRRLTAEQIKKKEKKEEKVKKLSKPEKVVEISEDANEFAEKLKKAGNILSYGLGVGIEQGKFVYQPNKDNRIVGTPTNPNEWPWMVFIEYLVEITVPIFGSQVFKAACNGALLDDSHVITQASCLPGNSLYQTSLDSVRVIIGDHNIVNTTDTNSFNVTVSKVTFPMTYSSIDVKDDIAVLTLSESVDLTDSKTVRPVCLPVSYNKYTDDTGILVGWTETSLNDPSDIQGSGLTSFDEPELNAIDGKLLDTSVCNATLNDIAAQLSILTGETSLDVDDYVCLVDKQTEFPVCDIGFGTPLVREDQTNAYFLYGISNQFSSCSTGTPSVFTAIKTDDQFLNLALS